MQTASKSSTLSGVRPKKSGLSRGHPTPTFSRMVNARFEELWYKWETNGETFRAHDCILGFGLQSVSLQRCSVPPPRAATCPKVPATPGSSRRIHMGLKLVLVDGDARAPQGFLGRPDGFFLSLASAIHSSLFHPFCPAVRHTNLLTCTPIASLPEHFNRSRRLLSWSTTLCAVHPVRQVLGWTMYNL